MFRYCVRTYLMPKVLLRYVGTYVDNLCMLTVRIEDRLLNSLRAHAHTYLEEEDSLYNYE